MAEAMPSGRMRATAARAGPVPALARLAAVAATAIKASMLVHSMLETETAVKYGHAA